MMKLAEGYAIAALREAYRVGDHSATLEIFGNVVMGGGEHGNSDLLHQVYTDRDLILSVLHSMTVFRKDWAPFY
jgi:hypothetical protein